MAIRVTDTMMTCDITCEYAKSTPDGWVVSWLPGRFFPQHAALTALNLMEIYLRRLEEDDPMWAYARAAEEELGIDERYRP